ncbi:MAG: hypothetical protein HWD58_21365 [Bacteroidota bacterium]|nr:MAG: hypothetical protein HWD58_21365 [Bacteroidota bacterium]
MQLKDVPQDKKDFKDGHQAPKKLMYVTRSDGSYTQTTSAGWEAENLALEQAWEAIEEQSIATKEQVIQGLVSPIAYYMIQSRMDLLILASYVGKWQWQVKRHMKPSVFRNLPEKLLQRYADAFNISLSELRKLPNAL